MLLFFFSSHIHLPLFDHTRAIPRHACAVPKMPSEPWWAAERIIGDYLLACTARRTATRWGGGRIATNPAARGTGSSSISVNIGETNHSSRTGRVGRSNDGDGAGASAAVFDEGQPPAFLYFFNHTPFMYVHFGLMAVTAC